MAAFSRTPSAVLHQQLLSQGVRCSLRGDGLRFAPHYFTDDEDLQRVVEVVQATG